MKVRYEFVNGEISEIEVDDNLGELLVDFDRQEYNNDHKETRRHYSLEGKVYEGMDYAVEDSGLEALFAGPTDEERLHAAIRQLSRDQQEMVQAIFFENVSVNDYAVRHFPPFADGEEKIEKTSGLTLIFSPSPGRMSEGARKAAFQKG